MIRLFLITVLSALTFISMNANAQEARMTNNNTDQAQYETAIVAAGCFWCIESDYDKYDGILKTVSGYTGGDVKNPTYEQVSAGNTGHREALQVTFDPSIISYAEILDIFWKNHDPFDDGGQFCDRGFQYTAAIYYNGADQKDIAEKSLAAIQDKLDQPIATDIVAASEFYPAEDYHQDYHDKHPIKYKFYRTTCGRDARLGDVWSDK